MTILAQYSDWLEIGGAIFSVGTFIVAIIISQSQDDSNKRFISNQVNEKIAVLYSTADAFHELHLKNLKQLETGATERYVIAPHLIERVTTDLQSIGDLANDIPKKKQQPLFTAVGVLVDEMKQAGYDGDATRVQSTFKSFFK